MTAPPIVAVVGNSDSGKTTVAGAIVEKLSARGYRVAAIKHCPHGHQVDVPESETGRLYDAGAVAVVASSPDKRTRVDRLTGEAALASMAGEFTEDVDLVVAEGFKTDGVPKVLVLDGAPLSLPVDNVIAVVGDGDARSDSPRYHTGQLNDLVGQLQDTFL